MTIETLFYLSQNTAVAASAVALIYTIWRVWNG